jgi:hypothetical protein
MTTDSICVVEGESPKEVIMTTESDQLQSPQMSNVKTDDREDLFQDERYVSKLNVYADKLGLSLDEIKTKRMSKNMLKKLVRNQVS